MSDKIIYLNNKTRLDIPIERVLSAAEKDLAKGIVVGYTEDGDFYFSTSIADGAEILWLLEQAKKKLLEVG